MENKNEKHNTCRATCAQVLATLAFNCLSVNVGIIIGMPMLIIGALRLTDPSLALSEEQASWFGGMIFMVQPLGSVVSGFLQDHLGRKMCMMLVNIPQLVAWLMMFKATSVATLFVGVTMLGLSIGFMEAPVLSYIGEISEPRLRGVLSTLGGVFLHVGFLCVAVMGANLDWRPMMLLSALGPVVAFLALAMVPDSPAWLVTKGRVEDARKSYQWLRGWVPADQVQEELDALVTYVKQTRSPRVVSAAEYKPVPDKEGRNNNLGAQESPETSKLKIFLHPSVQRPLRLIIIFMVVASCASLMPMRPFFIEFLAKLNLPIRPHIVNLIGTGLTMLGAVTSSLSMRRLGKRGLTFISLGPSVLCCFGIGLYLALDLQTPWVALLIIGISFYVIPLGIIAVPWILISELFPLRGRGIAGGVAAALSYALMFIAIKTYFSVVSLVTLPGACFLYGTGGLLGFIYLYFQLPETEGKTLEDIEAFFVDKAKPKRTQEKKTKVDLQMDKNMEVEKGLMDLV